MYWIYVLRNKTNGEMYYGYTNNLERRLKEHNVENKWKFIACEGYASELDVRDRERKLKHYGQARTHLKNRLKRSLEFKEANVMKRLIMVSMLASLLVMLGTARPAKAEIEEVTLRVDGLACPFCAYGLEKKTTRIKGVRSYDVDMREGKVFVGLEPDARIELDSLYKAVKEAGFTLKNVSLRVKGKIQQAKEGLVLVAKGSQERFLLFESEALSQKYHQGEIPKTTSDKLEKKLIQLKDSGKEVSIKGVIHKHEGLPLGLAVEELEVL